MNGNESSTMPSDAVLTRHQVFVGALKTLGRVIYTTFMVVCVCGALVSAYVATQVGLDFPQRLLGAGVVLVWSVLAWFLFGRLSKGPTRPE